MVQAVRTSIVKDVNESDVKWFALMEDGTRDKNNHENMPRDCISNTLRQGRCRQ